MAFESLSSELQNILLYNHEVFLKAIYLIILLSISLSYIFYFSKKQEQTPFFSTAVLRFIMSAVSYVFLVTLPILIFGFDPTYSGFDFIWVYFLLYSIVLTIYVLIVSIDVIRYGVPVLLKMGGLNMEDPNTKLAYQKIMKKIKNGIR